MLAKVFGAIPCRTGLSLAMAGTSSRDSAGTVAGSRPSSAAMRRTAEDRSRRTIGSSAVSASSRAMISARVIALLAAVPPTGSEGGFIVGNSGRWTGGPSGGQRRKQGPIRET